MQLLRYKPAPPLDAFVKFIWSFEGHIPGRTRERALPTGAVDLVFTLRDEPIRVFEDETDDRGEQHGGAIVHGAQSRYFVLEGKPQVSTVGVHFWPGGAAPFFPAAELTDRHVALGDLWGEAGPLRDRLIDAASPAARFAVLEQALIARIGRTPLVHPVVSYALRRIRAAPTLARVEQVREQTGYGAKRFIELFRRTVGLTPKLYCRIRRFDAAIALAASGESVEWAKVAADSGYFDQSHLNRDFRSFAGVAPGAYRPVSAERRHHIAVAS